MSDERITGEQPVGPFMLPPNKHSHFNGARIVEVLVIALITAVLTSLGTMKVLESKLESLEKQQVDFKKEIREDLQELRRDFYRPRWDAQVHAVPYLEGEQ